MRRGIGQTTIFMVSAGMLGVAKLLEEFLLSMVFPVVSDWLIFATLILVFVGLVTLPYPSVINPTSKLNFTIERVGFEGINRIQKPEFEPFIIIVIAVENTSDISQTIKWVSLTPAMVLMDAHELAHDAFKLTQTGIKRQSKKSLHFRLPVSHSAIEIIQDYSNRNAALRWEGKLTADISAKVWGIERGKSLESVSLNEYRAIPFLPNGFHS